MTSRPKRTRARRGDGEQLRLEIINAVKDLIVEKGSVESVSIRAVAQRVGVTTPSIYLHFADKGALLDAVVTDVFAELDVAIMKAAADVADQSPLTVLRAQGLAYIRFAVDHAEHYRVAVMEPCIVPPDVDEVIREGAFAHFMTTVQACMDAGVFADGDPLPIALDLWTAAHGIAALMIAKPYLPWGSVDEVGDRALCAAALGHAAIGLIGTDPTPDAITDWLTAHRP
ncbi:MAG: TetR/AcrR family transcriptional regulator [Jatrophihabitantaceae bacterium]